MTYARPFLRLVMSGTLHTTEQFSYGVSLISPSAGPPSAPTVTAAVRTAVETFHGAACSSAAKLQLIKLNLIGIDGKYASSTGSVFHDYGTTPFSPSGTITHAPQVALAVTLQSGVTRGPAKAGRFYIPSPAGGAVGIDGRMTVAHRDQIATNTLAFINSLNTALDGWRVGVVSDVGAGSQRAVRAVRVGRVYDTIRSRRNNLLEEYATTAVVTNYSAADDVVLAA